MRKPKPTCLVPRAQVRKAAARYFAGQDVEVGPDRLQQLLDLCAADLVERLAVPFAVAAEASLVAWADILGRRTRCEIDLAASTPHLVFLADPITGERHAIPVIDLVRLIGPRAVASPPAAPHAQAG